MQANAFGIMLNFIKIKNDTNTIQKLDLKILNIIISRNKKLIIQTKYFEILYRFEWVFLITYCNIVRNNVFRNYDL